MCARKWIIATNKAVIYDKLNLVPESIWQKNNYTHTFFYQVGEDFADFGPVLLDYRGGNRRVEVLEFVITIKDDDIPEPPEKFRIYGENTNNLLFPFPFMTVTITDDDEGEKLCFPYI